MKNNEVLLKPLYTEKTISKASSGIYTFIVSRKATKTDIRKALKDVFEVEAQKVSTIQVKGALRRVGKSRTKVTEQSYKKAFVTLKKGHTLNVFEFEEKSNEKPKETDKKETK